MREIGRIAQALFDKIRGRFDKVNLGNDKAKSTTDPTEAKFINFNYVSNTGNSFGHVTLSLIDDNNLKIYYNKKLSKSLAPEDKTEWYAFLKDLRHFARRNMINFETRDISRDGLNINDVKQASHADATFNKDDVNVQEAKHFKTAYGWAGGAKPGGGTYKHPDQIKADRLARNKVKSASISQANLIGIDAREKLKSKPVSEGWKKESSQSQERTRRDRAGMRVSTPQGDGVIRVEYKVPTFSQMVPFRHEIHVDLDNGKDVTLRARLVKKIKTSESIAKNGQTKTLTTKTDESYQGNCYDADDDNKCTAVDDLEYHLAELTRLQTTPGSYKSHIEEEELQIRRCVRDLKKWNLAKYVTDPLSKKFLAKLDSKKANQATGRVAEASHYGKDYGVRYKVFGGREGRLVTKDAFFTTQAQLDKAVEKIQNLGNFYEIDGYSLPPAKQGIDESRMFGSSRSSYQNMGPAKIIIKHSNPVNDEVRGSRTRNIESVFIQTNEGERFKLPFKKLAGARAMATHVSNGGTVYDDLGQHITETVKEMSALSGFVRNGRNKTFEDAEAMGMLEASMERYVTLHKNLRGMSNPRGYNAYKECFSPEKQMLGEVDIASLKEKFVKKDFDERLTPALEYAYRAYQNKLLEADKPDQYIAEFEDWANEITNVKKIPQTPEEFNQLSELLTSTLRVGTDGDNATNALRELIGDEELFDTIYAVSQSQGEEADARPIIVGWLSQNAPEVLDHVAVPDEMKQGDSEEAETPAVPTKLGPRQPVPQAPEEIAEGVDGAIEIKSKNGSVIGIVYQNEAGDWGEEYRNGVGHDMYDSKEDAIEGLMSTHNEHMELRGHRKSKEVAETRDDSLKHDILCSIHRSRTGYCDCSVGNTKPQNMVPYFEILRKNGESNEEIKATLIKNRHTAATMKQFRRWSEVDESTDGPITDIKKLAGLSNDTVK